MYSVVDTYRQAGIFAHLHLLVFVGGALWALVCAVLLGLRWRVPPILAVAPLCVVPLLIGSGSMWAYDVTTDAASQVDPASRATIMAAGLAEGMSQGWFGLLAVPVAGVLALGGLAAGVRAPRRWVVPVVVFGVAGLTALLPLVGLVQYTPIGWVLGRMFLYGLGVVPLALATANDHTKHNGPEGGMVAAAAWVTLVGACELALQTYGWTLGFAALANVDPEQRNMVLAAMSAEIGAQATLGWVLFALAGVPAVIVAFRSGPPLTEEEIMNGESSPSPGRTLGRVLALLVWPLWAFAMAANAPGSVIDTLTVAAAR